MQADKTPQLQKETSEKGASTTSGGAYSSRDDPRAQAAPPTEGKSEKQIIQVGRSWRHVLWHEKADVGIRWIQPSDQT